MSELGQNADPGEPNVMTIEALAADWVTSLHSDGWSQTHQADLDAWLTRSLAHRVAFIRLNSAWRRTNRLAAVRSPMRNLAVNGDRQRKLLGRSAAVGAFVTIFSASAVYSLWPSRAQIYETPVGGHRVVELSDGSEIELNTDTRLRVGKDGRRAWLDRGEAYFQIKHNSAHPFSVTVGAHRITDVGTKFSIRRQSDGLEITLIEGRAKFDAPGGKMRPSSLDLLPGDTVVVGNGSVSMTKKPLAALSTELSWRHGMVVFDHTKLGDVALEFNRYNQRKLVIRDQAAALRKIGGTFRVNDVERFVEVAQDALRLHVVRHDDEIVITAAKS